MTSKEINQQPVVLLRSPGEKENIYAFKRFRFVLRAHLG
jgi:hypothetical protein